MRRTGLRSGRRPSTTRMVTSASRGHAMASADVVAGGRIRIAASQPSAARLTAAAAAAAPSGPRITWTGICDTPNRAGSRGVAVASRIATVPPRKAAEAASRDAKAAACPAASAGTSATRGQCASASARAIVSSTPSSAGRVPRSLSTRRAGRGRRGTAASTGRPVASSSAPRLSNRPERVSNARTAPVKPRNPARPARAASSIRRGPVGSSGGTAAFSTRASAAIDSFCAVISFRRVSRTT